MAGVRSGDCGDIWLVELRRKWRGLRRGGGCQDLARGLARPFGRYWAVRYRSVRKRKRAE